MDGEAKQYRSQARDLETPPWLDPVATQVLDHWIPSVPERHDDLVERAREAEAARDEETLAASVVYDARYGDILSKVQRGEAAHERSLKRHFDLLDRLDALASDAERAPPPRTCR